MTKIMLVEDDKSLREIYGVRLQAEGYDIKSAGDGEEALAMAIKERPDLIIADVMMPKISGFDMLDILRATPETKDVKVIIMTALSSEDQRARGETLGANRYLVKSQVGIEDVVRAVHDLLSDAPQQTPAPLPPTQPAAPAPAPQMQPVVTPEPVQQIAPQPISAPLEAPTTPTVPVAAPAPQPIPTLDMPQTQETAPPMMGQIPQQMSTTAPMQPIVPTSMAAPMQSAMPYQTPQIAPESSPNMTNAINQELDNASTSPTATQN